MIGKTLGHYRVAEALGAGGMGVVYRARDLRLERDVALKVLPPGTLSNEDLRKQFRKEALALSRLNHPNIATIHDFDSDQGIDFIVMELISGDPLQPELRDREFTEEKILDIGIQLAEGLSAAHAAGVLHRDLKPANLRMTSDGRLKILDFGLARVHEFATTDALVETEPKANQVMGTIPYMAPEQLRGERLDQRTDIYGAGAVLYELAAGKRPFSAATTPSLIEAILRDAPPALSLSGRRTSRRIEQIIRTCLEKDPARRYQSARDLQRDLQALRSGASIPRRWSRYAALAAGVAVLVSGGMMLTLNVGGSLDETLQVIAPRDPQAIAVLPLTNASRDPGQEYFVDGMTRELTVALSRIGSLRVTSVLSTMLYKNKPKPLSEAARDLKVKRLIAGSVMRNGDRGRINLELIDPQSGRQLWSRSYDYDVADGLAAQARIAEAVAAEIDVRLTRKDKASLASLHAVNPAAHEEYLKGVFESSEGRASQAKEHFERAIAIDPNFPDALTALAGWYISRGWFAEAFPPMMAYPRAKELALRALQIDPGDAVAHTQLATIKMHHEWDWAGAEREIKRALELSPSAALAHHMYAHYYLTMDRLEESVIETRKAAELDPLNATFSTCVGWHCLFARQYDEAVQQCLALVNQQKASAVTYFYLGRVYARRGQYPDAIAALETAVQKSGSQNPMLATLGFVYGRAGRRAEAEQVLAELTTRAKGKYVSPFDFAVITAGLGDKAKTFEWLEKAYLERSTWLIHIKWDDRFIAFRTDPEFVSLLRRINLPDAATVLEGDKRSPVSQRVSLERF